MGWANYLAAFATFFIMHSLPLRPAIKGRLVNILGRRGFSTAYSMISLAALAWLIVAAAQTPFVELWTRANWQTWVPMTAMAAVCILVCFGAARPNPFSFGGARNNTFDPARPGLIRWLRHPLLAALALWALAHLVPNGDLAHVILFGVFGAFALLGMKLVDRRRKREMGPDQWAELRERVTRSPMIPSPASWRGTVIRGILSAGLYAMLIAAHPVVLGVSPLP
ncbi:NnrU family protein [Primorskyibacter flagellatus]|uniref:NnrU family protein n=1 Tax=Primorskyibacter flagellatus TaxID=1387277 RepID=UPI003A94D162